jgi:hypothetical protein
MKVRAFSQNTNRSINKVPLEVTESCDILRKELFIVYALAYSHTDTHAFYIHDIRPLLFTLYKYGIDCGLLCCGAVWSCRWLPAFQKYVSPPSSE